QKKTLAKKKSDMDMVAAPSYDTDPTVSLSPKPKFNTKVLYLVIGLLALSALLLANKSMLVAAVVDGRPVWSWELNSVMADRYGKQTLEGMISEKLIESEARNQGVVMSPSEVSAREEEIVKGLGGGMKLEEILKIQGLTKSEFDRQITLQLTVQKILGKDLTITDADVNNFIATNRATLVATEEAALRSEAKQAILDAHIGEKLQPWFNELKAKAKVLRFL
ncbi:MAG: SurA N-terminal domain-containing protein, partial [Patescibacteria group bacterium]